MRSPPSDALLPRGCQVAGSGPLPAPSGFESRLRHDALDAADRDQTDAFLGWWTRPGRVILGEDLAERDATDDGCWTGERTAGALTILQGAGYDPGSACYRFHSALNHTTPHASLFARNGNTNPYTNYRQLDMWINRPEFMVAVASADVVHCHIDTFPLTFAGVKHTGRVVINYHGSVHPDDPPGTVLVNEERDRRLDAIQIGARLDHAEYGDLAWVPMAQPVGRLGVLREMYRPEGRGGLTRPFRIAHSPTHRVVKGSDTLVTVVDALRAKGVRVECVMIEKHKHPHALAWKATCDACFDSFWLGLQGSGLEAGAMGMPVIAGDDRTRRLHEAAIGYCPYLFADTARQLEQAIMVLIEHPSLYDAAAAKIHRYVMHWHSYECVAAMYLNVLAERAPELRSKILRAMGTESDGNAVPAMRAGDDYAWLRPPHDPDWFTGQPAGMPARPARAAA